MAATIDIVCKSCGRAHCFYLPTADRFDAGRLYEYVCPSRAQTTRTEVISGANKSTVDSRPRGSVMVRQLEDQL